MASEIKILITGDFYAGNRINELIQMERYGEIFNDFLEIIQQNDLAIINLESALTEATIPIPKTGPAIKATPKTIEALRYAGFNLLTLANNHIMDFGERGLLDTIALCKEHEIDFTGAGLNYKEASKVFYKEIKNIKLAFINVAENEFSTTHGQEAGANPLNPVSNYYAIKQARNKVDFVFVIVHGGHEMYQLPSPRMKATYRFFADAGASAIIGHHTHCYSGCEVYNRVPIFYSLGNFIFDKPGQCNSIWNDGFAVEFVIGDKLSYNLIPYTQCGEKAGIVLMGNQGKKVFEDKVTKLSQIIKDDELLEKEFNSYCNSVYEMYASYLEPHSSRLLHALRKLKLMPAFLSKRKKLLLKNLIRCEAHRDVVLKVLSK